MDVAKIVDPAAAAAARNCRRFCRSVVMEIDMFNRLGNW
jgi:hypothetical protein